MKSFALVLVFFVALSVDSSILLCREGRFRCQNKAACVPYEYVCDGRDDCLDRSDETDCSNGKQCKVKNCSHFCIQSPYNNEATCTCPTGYHLDADARTCEDVNECDTSPSLCSQNCTNTPGSFECSCENGYIKNDDGSCRSNVSGQISSPKLVCTFGKHACENGESCISMDFVCDNSVDCGDGSDEANCESGKYCKLKNCDQTCLENSDYYGYPYNNNDALSRIEHGTNCVCDAGYKLGSDTRTCDDIDECALGTHDCTQRCINKDGTFQCSCTEGYYFDAKSHVCKASGFYPMLFLAKTDSIQIHNIAKNKTYKVNMRNELKGSVEKAVYSPDNKRIIILESFPEGGRILISDRLTVLKTLSLDYPFSGPEDMEIDWRTNNIYITDPSKGVIVACRLDNLTCSVVVSEKLSRPTRIVLDPIAGQMYWSDQGISTGIFSSHMDGEKVEVIATTDIYKPTAIAFDKPTGSVFWSDVNGPTYSIQGISLAGKRRWTLFSTMDNKFSPINDLAVFEDTAYFSTFSNVVFAFQKLNAPLVSLPKTQVSTFRFDRILSFSLYQPLLMPYEKFQNPCKEANCTEMCLLSNSSGFSCLPFVTIEKDRPESKNGTESMTSSFEEVDEDLGTETI